MLTSSAYWAFGIPLAWFFGMHQDLGVRGLWVGPVVACAYLTIMYNILIFCINWPSLYEEIRERRRVENAVTIFVKVYLLPRWVLMMITLLRGGTRVD